jgi:predicted permease
MIEIFIQVGTLFIFMAAGFFLTKTGLIKAEHSKILSTLIVYVFLPCNIFNTYVSKFTVGYISANYLLLLVALAITLFLMVVGYFGSKPLTKNKYDRGVYEYSLIVPNSGYMGYPLTTALMVSGLLGDSALQDLMVFGIPISLYIYTIGYCKLTKTGLSLKKLLNPIMITTFVGMLAGLVNLPMDQHVTDLLDKSSACMGPTAMLLGGITLAQYKWGPLFKKTAVYITVFARMIVLPVALGLLLPLFGVPKEIMQTAVLYFCLPCGMNTIVFPKLVGENCETGVSLAVISNIICCITVPIILSIFVV